MSKDVPLKRFLAPDAGAVGQVVRLAPDISRHAVVVLRAAAGERVRVFDGRGAEFAGVVEEADPAGALVRLTKRLEGATAKVAVTLGFAPPPRQRTDLLIEKTVELGVAALTPVLCERLQGFQADAAARRIERWRRKAREAARQSQRTNVPEVREPVPLAGFLAEEAELKLVAVLESGEPLWSELEAVPNRPERVALLVGPAGGFTRREADEAVASGFRAVSLGPHTLRAETAAIVLLAAVQLRFQDQGHSPVSGS